MKLLKLAQLSVLLLFIITMLNSCKVVGDIFKAGVWVGILAVIGIIALILYFVGKAKK